MNPIKRTVRVPLVHCRVELGAVRRQNLDTSLKLANEQCGLLSTRSELVKS